MKPVIGTRAALAPLLMLAAVQSVYAAAPQPGSAAAAVREGVEAATRGDHAAAVAKWQGPAAAGDADAQFNLGMAYKRGLGVPVDMARAEELFRKSSAQGHLDAADQYGLLLFQTGRRREALPWLESAAERGEARAQYVLGTARYNGDFVTRDWVSAYALMSRAAAQGLPQATSSLSLMDQSIPLEQRQQGVALAAEMAKKAEALHASQSAQAGLGAPRVGPGIAATELPPSVATGELPGRAVAMGTPPAVRRSPDRPEIGASYATPSPAQRAVEPEARPMAPRPVATKATKTTKAAAPAAVAAAPTPPQPAAGSGRWRVQLGAFGQPGNADAAWRKASARPELAGKARSDVPGGKVVRLQAGPFASEAAAAGACSGLKAAGLVCVVVRP